MPVPHQDRVHHFHIPVMGTGFTIATPLRVAKFGIDSVVSIVDDILVEQTRHRVAAEFGKVAHAIGRRDSDVRARRIAAYLDLLEEIVHEQVEVLRGAAFEKGSEITRYFELLPPSPLRSLYERVRRMADGPEKHAAQDALRAEVRPGAIDVNIMTKIDRDPETGAIGSGSLGSAALAALRGFATSRSTGAVVFSAGMNLRLYTYAGEFGDFFPDAAGRLRKRIILKVQDLRSAAIQGKVLAKRGLWVSEFRIESGLNCGGHAFGDRGRVLGPILDEFREGRAALQDRLLDLTNRALRAAGRAPFDAEPSCRFTVQGGIGTAEEANMLRQLYEVDGTGWASPFLLVPEVVSLDSADVDRLSRATEDDVQLSQNSPLGVPFWNLKTSASEQERLHRRDAGVPGSACPKGYLIFDSQFSDKGLCTASRRYQKKKLDEIAATDLTPAMRADAEEAVTAKACLCRDLAGGAEPEDERGVAVPTAICCGPNLPYFSAIATLKEMVDHIYGRAHLPLAANRPHMFVKELGLHLTQLEEQAERGRRGLVRMCPDALREACSNLLQAIDHYAERAPRIGGERSRTFVEQLEALRERAQGLQAPIASAV